MYYDYKKVGMAIWAALTLFFMAVFISLMCQIPTVNDLVQLGGMYGVDVTDAVLRYSVEVIVSFAGIVESGFFTYKFYSDYPSAGEGLNYGAMALLCVFSYFITITAMSYSEVLVIPEYKTLLATLILAVIGAAATLGSFAIDGDYMLNANKIALGFAGVLAFLCPILVLAVLGQAAAGTEIAVDVFFILIVIALIANTLLAKKPISRKKYTHNYVNNASQPTVPQVTPVSQPTVAPQVTPVSQPTVAPQVTPVSQPTVAPVTEAPVIKEEPKVDAASELRKLKALLDEEIIDKETYDAKAKKYIDLL